MSNRPSMPFEAEKPALESPERQAAIKARQAYEQSVREARAKWEARAEQQFDIQEQKRRAAIIAEWKDDNPFKSQKPEYRFEGWSDSEIYRESLPYDTRIPQLLQAGLFDQALRCWLVRKNLQAYAPVAECQKFLEPYMPVRGSHSIVPSDRERDELAKHGRGNVTCFADGLSQEMCDLLLGKMMKVRFDGTVSFDWQHYHFDSERTSW